MIWAGAPRRPGGSNRSPTNSHCSSDSAIAKLIPASVRAGRVSLSGADPTIGTGEFGYRPLEEVGATGRLAGGRPADRGRTNDQTAAEIAAGTPRMPDSPSRAHAVGRRWRGPG